MKETQIKYIDILIVCIQIYKYENNEIFIADSHSFDDCRSIPQRVDIHDIFLTRHWLTSLSIFPPRRFPTSRSNISRDTFFRHRSMLSTNLYDGFRSTFTKVKQKKNNKKAYNAKRRRKKKRKSLISTSGAKKNYNKKKRTKSKETSQMNDDLGIVLHVYVRMYAKKKKTRPHTHTHTHTHVLIQ